MRECPSGDRANLWESGVLRQQRAKIKFFSLGAGSVPALAPYRRAAHTYGMGGDAL